MERFATTAFLALLCAVSASAQPTHGDMVLSALSTGTGRAGLFYFDRSANNLVTLTTTSRARYMDGVAMAANNVDIVVGDFCYDTRMLQVTPAGVATTIGTLWGIGGSVDGLQNGHFVWATQSGIQEIDGAGNVTHANPFGAVAGFDQRPSIQSLAEIANTIGVRVP